MSKIGQFNIAMTEKVNELGYETVEEAIADGWDSNEFYMSYMKEVKDEQEKAHDAWLKEREEVVNGLKRMLDLWKGPYTDYELACALGQYQDNLGKAIEFIERGEQ